MPKLGAADIDAVYLGGSVVDKIYLGSNAVYTAIAPPSQVTGLAVDSTGDGTIDLSWTAPASEAAITDYRIEYTPSGGSATEVLVGSNATSYQLTGLTNDTEYSVRVAAISAGGQGDYSAAVTGTPASGPVALTFTQTASGCSPAWQVGNIPASATTIRLTMSGNTDNGGGPFSNEIRNFPMGSSSSAVIDLTRDLTINHNGSGGFTTAVQFSNAHSFSATIEAIDSGSNVVAEIAGTSWSKIDCGD